MTVDFYPVRPSQVFFILLIWLQALIASGTVSADKLKSIYIAYDNMTCVDSIAKKPLPLQPPMDCADSCLVINTKKLWIHFI